MLVGEGKTDRLDAAVRDLAQQFLHAALAAQGARLRRAASASL